MPGAEEALAKALDAAFTTEPQAEQSNVVDVTFRHVYG